MPLDPRIKISSRDALVKPADHEAWHLIHQAASLLRANAQNYCDVLTGQEFLTCAFIGHEFTIPHFGVFAIWPDATVMNARTHHDQRYIKSIALLRDERKQRGVTQAELASRLGKTQQFVSKFESGERRLDVVEFVEIVDHLGLDRTQVMREI